MTTVGDLLLLSDSEVTDHLQGFPVLLHRGLREDGSEAGGFVTQAVPPDARAIEVATGLALHPLLEVILIRKAPSAPFPDRVGVGRARNVDIWLPHPKISKYHGYFSSFEGGIRNEWVDVGSKNGTFVNEQRIAPKVPVTLADRTVIGLAGYHVRFHTAEGFARALRVLR